MVTATFWIGSASNTTMSGFSSVQIDELTQRRACAGDRKALSEVCRVFAAPVLTLCYRLTGDRTLADDLTQETFVEVLRGLSGFRGEASLATWVRRIAVSRCLMHQRSAWNRKVSPIPETMELAGEGTPEQAFAVGHDIARALKQLPDTYRVVVWLYDVEGYTHQEIAEATGKSVSFSKSSLSRARAALRRIHESEAEPLVGAACPAG